MTEMAMIEAVRAAGGPGDPSFAYAANAAAPVADPAAVDAFQAAMATEKADPIPFAAEVVRTWRSAEYVEQGHLRRACEIASPQDRHLLAPMELAAMQYEMVTMGFNLEVTMSVAKKTSDAVSTLIKNG